MSWRPLSARGSPGASDAYDVLHEGIPEWMTSGITAWVRTVFGRYGHSGDDPDNALRVVERMLRMPLDWSYNGSALEHLCGLIEEDDDRALDIVDISLFIAKTRPDRDALLRNVQFVLDTGGSAWTVNHSTSPPSLERRVEWPVEDAAKTEMAEPGNAGIHLREAWHKVYGRQTDSSGAFREAVRAVEAAAKPTVTPKDPVATLGKMIIAMRDKPSKWASDLGTVPQVVEMMGQLWTSQLDRHGTDDESVRLSVSLKEAEAAVHLAVLLVHWFRNGHVKAI